MNRLSLFLLTFLAVPLLAQTPQRTDINSLLTKLPKLPSTTQNALETVGSNDRYLNYADELARLIDNIKQLNPISIRMQNQAVATDAKFKADGVDKMSDTEKLDYAKKQGLGGPGANNRIDFAQKMQDPAFRKQFEAMTPQEKMALMQQQGVMAAPAAVPQTSNPMQADMMAMMQDPAMREKWKSMSPAEKQSFIEHQKKAKGYDASKRPGQPSTTTSGGFSDMLDSPSPTTPQASAPIGTAIATTRALQESITSLAKSIQTLTDLQVRQDDQAMADMQKAITEAGKKQANEGIAEAKRQGKSGIAWILTNPAEEHRIRMAALQRRQQLDNTTLAAATAEWTKRQAAFKQLTAAYQNAMTAIQYGESLFADNSQFQNLATLSSQQAMVFSALQDIDKDFGKIASQAAKTQDLLVAETKMTLGPRQLLPASGG